MITEEMKDKIALGGAQQTKNEIEWFTEKLSEIKPKRILEIGTGCGAFTTLLLLSGAEVVTVDRFVNEIQWWEGKIDNPTITQYKGSSQTEEMANNVKSNYDLVIIDADHSLEGGYKDWELYSNMAPIVAIHDTKDWLKRQDLDWFPSRFIYDLYNKEGYKELLNITKIEEFDNCPTGGWVIVYKG